MDFRADVYECWKLTVRLSTTKLYRNEDRANRLLIDIYFIYIFTQNYMFYGVSRSGLGHMTRYCVRCGIVYPLKQ